MWPIHIKKKKKQYIFLLFCNKFMKSKFIVMNKNCFVTSVE